MWAAVARTWQSPLAYLALSGAAVAAVRSFIMITIIFTAVILNRPAFSQRNSCYRGVAHSRSSMPQSLIDAGFQMSFAATRGIDRLLRSPRPALQHVQRLGRAVYALPLLMFIVAAAMTTFFASLAVDPFAAYHFHRIALYSMLGNVRRAAGCVLRCHADGADGTAGPAVRAGKPCR